MTKNNCVDHIAIEAQMMGGDDVWGPYEDASTQHAEAPSLTPGARYRIDIHDHAVYVIVDLPSAAQPSSATAALVRDRLSSAVAVALSPLWSKEVGEIT